MSSKRHPAGTTREPFISQRLAKAFGHPLRVRLLEALATDIGSAKTLSDSFGVQLGDAAYHLKVLRELGLLEQAEAIRRRGSIEKLYRLDIAAFRAHVKWDILPPGLNEALQGSSLRGFMNAVASALQGGSLESDKATLCWSPVVLDRVGLSEVNSVLSRAGEEIEAAVADSASRIRHEQEAMQVVIGLAAFKAAPTEQQLDGGKAGPRGSA